MIFFILTLITLDATQKPETQLQTYFCLSFTAKIERMTIGIEINYFILIYSNVTSPRMPCFKFSFTEFIVAYFILLYRNPG